MAGEWIHTSLADVIEIISGGTPKTNVPEYWNGDIPWLSVADFNAGYRWVSRTEKNITKRGLSESATTLLCERDIIISARGTVGALAQLTRPMAFNQSCYGIRGKREIADTDFIYYFLRKAVAEMKQVAHGGVFDTITRDTFKLIEVSLPPLEEQRAIAHILGTLDDKIENLRRQNETLEAMARTLFKAWFVDFEPVRAKTEGRWRRGESLPGLPAELWELFPDRLVESELGEIPEGWEVTSLSEFSDLNPETWTRRTRPEEIRYIDLSNTKWGRIESITHYDANDAPSRAQRVLRPLDTVVGTVRPGNGSYALILDEGLTGSTGFAVLRPLRREYSEFVYLAATARENIERLSNLADGGAYPAVRPEIVSTTPVPRIGEELIKEFSRHVRSMLSGIAVNELTSRTLAQLRDTLLPKLISGVRNSPDAERIVGAAV